MDCKLFDAKVEACDTEMSAATVEWIQWENCRPRTLPQTW